MSLSSKPRLPGKLLSTVNFSATPSHTKLTPSICADRGGHIQVGVKGDPRLFHFCNSVYYLNASKGSSQLLELFEVQLSLCVGTEAQMNRVLYIGYTCYLLLVITCYFSLMISR